MDNHTLIFLTENLCEIERAFDAVTPHLGLERECGLTTLGHGGQLEEIAAYDELDTRV